MLMVLASLLSLMLANGLSAPQHSMYFGLALPDLMDSTLYFFLAIPALEELDAESSSEI